MCSGRFSDDNVERKNDGPNFLGVISRKYRFICERIQSRSILVKKLSAFVVLGSVSSAIMMCLLIHHFGIKYQSKVCVDYGCILSAARILEGMNTSADPCDDFYEYMCGNWPTQHLNPADEVNSWFLERAKIMNSRIKYLLEDPSDNEDVKPVKQMKKFYNLCSDTVSLNRKGLSPIFRILDRLGLPRILPTVDTAADLNLAQVLSRAQRLLNFDILIQLSVHFNTTSNINMLSVGPATNDISFLSKRKPPALNVHRSEISPEEYLIHQVSYMTAVIDEICDGVLMLDDITREAIKIVFLEAQLKLDVEETSEDQEEYMTFSALQDLMFTNISMEAGISPFKWRDYLAALTQDLNISLTMSSEVRVMKPIYFQMLGHHFVNLRPINFQRFVWWKVVQAIATHTTDVMRMHEYMFNQYILRGIAQLPTRSSVCIELTKTLFSEALAFTLSSQLNITQITNEVSEMMGNIKSTFREMITNSEWVDEATKNINIRKLDSIKTFVGYPPHLLDSKWIGEHYKKVKVFRNDFLETLLSIRALLVDDALAAIHTSGRQYGNYENDSWTVDPTEVNALLQPRNKLYSALNYGAIGSILGHELTHGFDNEGKDYDWKGDKKVTWSAQMISMYNNRSQCFIDQYSKYVVSSNLTIDGNMTLAENIADNGGIKEAFYAYERYERENGVEKLLPGFENFSHKKLLFMSFANVWCKKQNEVSLKLSVLDEHSPNRYRVIGSLSNLDEFSRTWKCDVNAKMNPRDKCVLW